MDEFAICFLAGAAAWLVLQVLAVWKLRGMWKKAAWLSGITMALALVVAILGVLSGSNLAPIWVVFAMPVCLLWIVSLWPVSGAVWVVVREFVVISFCFKQHHGGNFRDNCRKIVRKTLL